MKNESKFLTIISAILQEIIDYKFLFFEKTFFILIFFFMPVVGRQLITY